MSDRVLYRLVAQSPFHFGERGVGLEGSSVILRADTLFSALCLALQELAVNLDKFLELYTRVVMDTSGQAIVHGASSKPPFRMTSAFPFVGDIHIFPRPMVRPRGLDEVRNPKLGKTLKKIRFVSQSIFEAMLAGETVTDFLLKVNAQSGEWEINHDVLLQGGKLWVTETERARLLKNNAVAHDGSIALWRTDTVPHVMIDRVTSRSQIYHAGRVHYISGGGLYFLAEYQDLNWREPVETALRALGESGIGGERSSGHGQFCLQVDESFSLREVNTDACDGYCTLAPYWPTAEETKIDDLLTDSSYSLIARRGWVATPGAMNRRRRGVQMISEGSVCGVEPRGALADVNPFDEDGVQLVPHNVWRYGLAFPVRCSRNTAVST